MGYIFSLNNHNAKQIVGKDTMGYLLMEKGVEEIAEFLKTTIKAIETRTKYVNYKCTGLDNPNRAAAEVYKKDKTIGHMLQTFFNGNYNEENLNHAGIVIHIVG